MTHSTGQRIAKVSAAILGGLVITILAHMVLALWVNHVTVIISSSFSAFILWAILMVLAFLGKNGWKILGIYLLLSLVLGAILYVSIQSHPII
ncbi:MAG: hypothetical protein ABJN84_13190 [Flavobacteriaceae bacterium]